MDIEIRPSGKEIPVVNVAGSEYQRGYLLVEFAKAAMQAIDWSDCWSLASEPVDMSSIVKARAALAWEAAQAMVATAPGKPDA